MSEAISNDVTFELSKPYSAFLVGLKEKVRSAQIKASLSVNSQLITMYWELGKDIVLQQEQYAWGSDFINQLSKDLSNAFPGMKGFSRANLYRIKKFFLFYNKDEKVAQPARQIPWWHNVLIIEKIKDIEQATWYIHKTIEHGWSRNVLSMQIESRLYERQVEVDISSITNVVDKLPQDQSDLFKDVIKDPYMFDFLGVGPESNEREIEAKLMENMRKFLLELGSGFAFVGQQYHLEVGGDDFYIDMLFYHIKLRCYIVIELKATKFKPEYAGKLGFYISVVDDMIKTSYDNPTIGLLLCKDKNKIVAEYSLQGQEKPMGISSYQMQGIQSALPSIEAIEKGLSDNI